MKARNDPFLCPIIFTPQSKFIITWQILNIVLIYIYFMQIPIIIAFGTSTPIQKTIGPFKTTNVSFKFSTSLPSLSSCAASSSISTRAFTRMDYWEKIPSKSEIITWKTHWSLILSASWPSQSMKSWKSPSSLTIKAWRYLWCCSISSSFNWSILKIQWSIHSTSTEGSKPFSNSSCYWWRSCWFVT